MEEIVVPLKINVVGNAGVGKTSIIERFVNNKIHDQNVNSIFCALNMKQIVYNKKEIKVVLWDVGRQAQNYDLIFRNTQICLVVFDPHDPKSFEDVNTWIETVRQTTANGVIYVVVCNKIDLANPLITHEMAQNLCNSEKEVTLKMCSAKTGEGVNELFDFVIGNICEDDELFEHLYQQQLEYQQNAQPRDLTKDYSVCRIL
ncbi:hypothetical protein EIN_285460 [Entamoeba invadens IP1]|uniref:Uncharacterized protein n=1 Tax=Entamoeba invadens IP1 TaxID=370355 RepID=A0A0A1U534_ENTIV|nr:hypothetical protein EIN_285460 [Entamoeba invadens IP1]ELP89320.1 hypothetical protein EIN_285460 [Entamoeba invadens IP1]|eukprot:XP_004256091.1 hypothetical protein EIN_285460 [Entamoeba invadens IP1]